MPKLNHGRIRDLHPEFFTDERVLQVSIPARLLFQGLWLIADRAGRLEEPHPLTLRARFFPADNVDCAPMLEELVKVGLVLRYTADDRSIMWIPGFRKRQRLHPREQQTKLPPHPADTNIRNSKASAGTEPAGFAKVSQGSPRHEKAGKGDRDRRDRSGPSGSIVDPPPTSSDETAAHSADPSTSEEERIWKSIQWRRANDDPDRVLAVELHPPRGFRDWVARALREGFTVDELERAHCAYLLDDAFRLKGWPTAVFITDGVWRQRTRIPPPKRGYA